MTDDVTSDVTELATTEKLGPKQAMALEALQSGRTVGEAAEAAGVVRATIYRWLQHNYHFAAAFNRWHAEMVEMGRSDLLALAEKARKALDKSLERGDARTALALMKGLGLLVAVEKRPTDAAELKKRAQMGRRERQLTLEADERKVELDGQVARMTDREIGAMVGGGRSDDNDDPAGEGGGVMNARMRFSSGGARLMRRSGSLAL